MAHHCSTLILHCIDFRFGRAIRDYLEENNLLGDADIVAVAGAAKNIADPRDSNDAKFILRQIGISRRLHGIRRVILMNHTDCGAYGGRAAFADEAVERDRLINDVKKAGGLIKDAFPELEVRMALAKIAGETVEIEDIV